MKKALRTIGLLLWIVGFLALIILGVLFSNNVVLFTGIGVLFGGAAVISIVMAIVAAKRSRKNLRQPVTREEQQRREEVEGRRTNDPVEQLEQAMTTTATLWRVSNKADKIKGTLFLVSFLTCCVLFIVFLSIDKFVWGLIAWGCGMGMMVIALIVVTIKDHVSKRKEKKEKGGVDYCACMGRVLSCTTVEDGALYEVLCEAEGRRAKGISTRPYMEGQLLDVLLDKERGRVVIKDDTVNK